jgi:MoaA/NifB/PqqE/SkfB family radical SAM enzyme
VPGALRRLKDGIKRVPLLGPALKGLRDERRFQSQQTRYREQLARLRRGEDPGSSWSVGHEPTIRCNLRCSFCYQGDSRGRRRDDLPPEEVIRCYERIPSLRRTKLVGGEIFVYRGLDQVLDYLDDRGVGITLQTNGTLIDEEVARALARRRHIRAVIVSVDGPAAIHDDLRGHAGAFAKTMRAIRLVREHLPWAEIGVFTMLLPESAPHLQATFRELAATGIHGVQLLFEQYYTEAEIAAARRILVAGCGFPEEEVWINTNHREDHPFQLPELQAALAHARRAGRREGVLVNPVPANFARWPELYLGGPGAVLDREVVCAKLLDREVRIDPSGNVLLCDVVEAPCGNLTREPLEAIVAGERFGALQRQLLRGPLPVCYRCCKALYL